MKIRDFIYLHTQKGCMIDTMHTHYKGEGVKHRKGLKTYLNRLSNLKVGKMEFFEQDFEYVHELLKDICRDNYWDVVIEINKEAKRMEVHRVR